MPDEEPIPTEIPDHEEGPDSGTPLLARATPEWGSGWPNCQGNQQATAHGGGVRVTCRHEIAELVGLLLEATVQGGYHIRQADTGAFNCRPIGGTSTASNHSWGLAIDINWNTNGFGYNVSHDIPQWVIDLWKTYGFSYGGDWSGKKDWMHFEWKRSKADAIRFTDQFKSDHVVTPPKPPEPSRYGILNSPVVGAATHGGN